VIAVRGGPTAKSRCADALSDEERAQLVEVMLEDMLDTIVQAAGVTETWVVTPTAEIAALASRRGVRVVRQSEPARLNSGFQQALDVLTEEAPYASVVLLLGDLPLLAANELEAVIALSKTHQVVLAPTVSDGGTSAIGLAAGARFRMAFGHESFRRHGAIARGLGLSLAVVDAKSLSRDVDRPEDLFALIDAAPASRTGRFLREHLTPRVTR
jgi:2-phospho-L-lactate guanylyltransferase